jgi:hypothetical protein
MRHIILTALLPTCATLAPARAQEILKDYQEVLTILGKTGDFSANVVKANVPRSDLSVQIASHLTPTPFGFGGWLAFTHASDGSDVMMGDLVLTQEEVNPVMSTLLDHGLEVTALHYHSFYEQPRLSYMHVHGHGSAADLARSARSTKALRLPQNPPTCSARSRKSFSFTTAAAVRPKNWPQDFAQHSTPSAIRSKSAIAQVFLFAQFPSAFVDSTFFVCYVAKDQQIYSN